MALSRLSLQSRGPQGTAPKDFTVAFPGRRRETNAHTLRVPERGVGGGGGSRAGRPPVPKAGKTPFSRGKGSEQLSPRNPPGASPAPLGPAPRPVLGPFPTPAQIHHLLNPSRAAGLRSQSAVGFCLPKPRVFPLIPVDHSVRESAWQRSRGRRRGRDARAPVEDRPERNGKLMVTEDARNTPGYRGRGRAHTRESAQWWQVGCQVSVDAGLWEP